jgi:hypothetical protein
MVSDGSYRSNSKFSNLNWKKWKILEKFLKNTSRFIDSNGVKIQDCTNLDLDGRSHYVISKNTTSKNENETMDETFS